jgi:neutral trehalase
VRFAASDIAALDRDRSGAVTKRDVETRAIMEGHDSDGRAVPLVVDMDAASIGRAARVFAFAKIQHTERTHISLATPAHIDIPQRLLEESAPERALLAADSYQAFARTTRAADVIDALVRHADAKLGVFHGGLVDEHGAPRVYGVVGEDGALVRRTARYDGKRAFLYVPSSISADTRAALEGARNKHPRGGDVEIRAITPAELASREERLALKYDRPGLFYVSTRCPVLPQLNDDRYVVPGGRFGIELYYHDARINAPGMRSTITALAASGEARAADDVLSLLRGTANALINELLAYGKIMNATLTSYAGRSQPPGLTTVILETYRAWRALHPEQAEDAGTWLAWARDAAVREHDEVWIAPPRFDEKTGLSRYVDETPSVAPEEDARFYDWLDGDPQAIASDAAMREHGWDSAPGALLTSGPEKGKPRQHQLLPVCLNSALFKSERELATMARLLGEDASAARWEVHAETRKATMDALMWDEKRGLYCDLVQPKAHARARPPRNGVEELRGLSPLWAGLVEPGGARAQRMHKKAREFLRAGGLATATRASWNALRKLNPAYVEKCQWGHKDIGWPIAEWETVEGLRTTGDDALANEVAYRWCLMVQDAMDLHGGLHPGTSGGYTAPLFEKMDVTHRSHEGSAHVGYGNQGAGDEGAGGGFRWGLDAYKLLYRSLPSHLQQSLHAHVDPDALFLRMGRCATTT